MTLGTYVWKNFNGPGEDVEIDVDALPTTDLPPNVHLLVPVVRIEGEALPAGYEHGELCRALVPNFRLEAADDAEGGYQLHHSTDYSEQDYDSCPLQLPDTVYYEDGEPYRYVGSGSGLRPSGTEGTRRTKSLTSSSSAPPAQTERVEPA
jgi:hypothetical protein